jgi:hypothetical protein
LFPYFYFGGKTTFQRSELENYQPQPWRQESVAVAILYPMQNLSNDIDADTGWNMVREDIIGAGGADSAEELGELVVRQPELELLVSGSSAFVLLGLPAAKPYPHRAPLKLILETCVIAPRRKDVK